MKDGRILSGDYAIVNQILPHRNKWAWDLYLKGRSNHWIPSEVRMGKDIQQWKDKKALTDDERLLVRRCLGFFAGSESLVANNLLLTIFRIVGDAECRQYLGRQNFEELLHNETIVYICDSLGLDISEVYEAYQNIPSIKAKDDFLMEITRQSQDLDLTTIKGKRNALRNIITYYIVCEGMFFYSGFAMLLNFGRQNKLRGISEQIQFTLRDESLHVEFGTKLINTIVAQEDSDKTNDEDKLFNEEFKRETIEHIRKTTELEIAYAKDILPRGILGMNSDMFVEYMKYIANRRLEQINLPKLFKNPRNPFDWLSEVIDMKKMNNFFETTQTEYSSGTLHDDMD